VATQAVASETPVIPPTATGAPTVAPFVDHEVQPGETLINIALAYGVSTDAIVAANNLADENLVRIGQILRIPLLPADVGVVEEANPTGAATTVETETGTPQATATQPAATTVGNGTDSPANWPPSLTSGDLAGNYPLLQQTASGALLIHYQPGTYPAANIESLAGRIDQIFERLQVDLHGTVPQQVDVYLGGTLFSVNPSLQGFTQSYEFRTFILVNGAFDPGERDYILGHELSHVAATHILGPASSTMIHEGLATYLPQSYLTNGAGYLSLKEICAAAYRTDAFRSATQLSQLGYGATAFGGHIRTFFNYNLSGCFVGYLWETYGLDRLDQVYDGGNYSGVYGLSLGELDAAWQQTLEATSPSVDPQQFVSMAQSVGDAYETYVNASAGGYHANYEAYLHLNRARLEANRGNLAGAQRELDSYWSLMGS
jgi:LysM repeat protein